MKTFNKFFQEIPKYRELSMLDLWSLLVPAWVIASPPSRYNWVFSPKSGDIKPRFRVRAKSVKV